MQHTQTCSQHHRQHRFQQTRIQLVAAIMCAVWLAMGGVIPAHAATPTGGALSQSPQSVIPTRLLIPSLGVDAPIEGVGQNEDDFMASPSTVAKVAWYNLGAVPGEPGNAVMAGHLDDVKGRPAVFWDLDELEADDEIVVQLSDESEIRFAVVSVEVYDADAAPLARIFGVDFERDLNLITCDGEWDTQSKLYEKRLVVYARRIHDGETSIVPDGLADETMVATTHLADAAVTETEAISASATLTSAGTISGTTDSTTVTSSSEYGDDSTQTNTAPTSPVPPSPRSPYTRQDRGQPLAAR